MVEMMWRSNADCQFLFHSRSLSLCLEFIRSLPHITHTHEIIIIGKYARIITEVCGTSTAIFILSSFFGTGFTGWFVYIYILYFDIIIIIIIKAALLFFSVHFHLADIVFCILYSVSQCLLGSAA